MSGRPLRHPPQFDPEHASRWRDPDAAASYRNRAPYPAEVFDLIEALVVDEPRSVLDAGCGTGAIARALAPRVARVDAIDLAAEMIDAGRALPGGDAPNLHWRVGLAESAPLDPPYALIPCAQSLHWMDWATVLPRFARALTPGGVLAVVGIDDRAPTPWRSGLDEIIARHSTAKRYEPLDLLPLLESGGLFRRHGERSTPEVEFEQTVAEFIDAHHAMSTLTRAHIEAAAFDAEVRALLTAHCPDGVVRRRIAGHVAWGRPLAEQA
jgi:SAM-dependent methyltransferase